jgi:hypothetical protein
MTDQTGGLVIGGLGLATFAGAVVAIRAGALHAVVAAVMPGAGMVVLLALVVATLGARRTNTVTTAGRMAVGHAHGDRGVIARHEAGHVAAARAVGGQVISATASNSEGLVRAVVPDVRASVTFLRAGRYAAGTRRGCGGDECAERAELRDVPRGERRQLVRDADRDARRIVRQYSGQIGRDARTLEQRGRL